MGELRSEEAQCASQAGRVVISVVNLGWQRQAKTKLLRKPGKASDPPGRIGGRIGGRIRGDNGVVILADKMLPPSKHGVMIPGPDLAAVT